MPVARAACFSSVGSGAAAAAGAAAGAAAAEQAAAALAAAEEAATALATAAAPTAAGFWKLAFAFVCGGLFFSTAIAAAGAIWAFGMDNVQRAWSTFGLVVRRVWKMLGAMIAAAYTAMRADTETPLRDALARLREGFGEARRAAAEGVEAIRQEATLYAAAVGKPGLLALQYVVDRVSPLALASAIEANLRAALGEARSSNFRSMRLREFTIGDSEKASPTLLSARAYDIGPSDLGFDIDLRWSPELVAKIEVVAAGVGARVPVSVRSVVFDGTVRLVVVGLQGKLPGYGALLLSLPSPPKIGMDVRVAGGEVTKLPWLKKELERAIQGVIAEQYLWPRRLVLPAELPPASPRSVLGRDEIARLAVDDPLLAAERSVAEQPAAARLREERSLTERDDAPMQALLDIFFGEKGRQREANGEGGGGGGEEEEEDDDVEEEGGDEAGGHGAGGVDGEHESPQENWWSRTAARLRWR